MTERVVDRVALAGVVIAGGFGVAWTLWAASGLTGRAAAAVRIAGVVLGVLIVAGALAHWRTGGSDASAPRGPGSMFRSRGYRVWITVEVVALVGGNAVLTDTGHSTDVAAWTALVVGAHFLGFGRLFTGMFYWLGAAFIVAAVVGAAAGSASGTSRAVEAATGLIAAGSLFIAGGWGLRSASSGTRPTLP